MPIWPLLVSLGSANTHSLRSRDSPIESRLLSIIERHGEPAQPAQAGHAEQGQLGPHRARFYNRKRPRFYEITGASATKLASGSTLRLCQWQSYACFSFLCRVARELTQGSAERNQFCRRGTKSRRWRKIPTRTM